MQFIISGLQAQLRVVLRSDLLGAVHLSAAGDVNESKFPAKAIPPPAAPCLPAVPSTPRGLLLAALQQSRAPVAPAGHEEGCLVAGDGAQQRPSSLGNWAALQQALQPGVRKRTWACCSVLRGPLGRQRGKCQHSQIWSPRRTVSKTERSRGGCPQARASIQHTQGARHPSAGGWGLWLWGPHPAGAHPTSVLLSYPITGCWFMGERVQPAQK